MRRTYQTSAGLPADEAQRALTELRLGYLNLSDEFFPQAEMNFNLALEYDKTCADAYWGLMLVKLKISSEDKLFENPMKYKNAILLPECEKALEFADENLKKVYVGLLEKIYRINDGDNY